MTAALIISAILAILLGGANWLVDYDNRTSRGYRMRWWPPVVTIGGVVGVIVEVV